MKKVLQIPKIQQFQESLAAIFKGNMVIMDVDGRLLNGYNRQSLPFSLFGPHRQLPGYPAGCGCGPELKKI